MSITSEKYIYNSLFPMCLKYVFHGILNILLFGKSARRKKSIEKIKTSLFRRLYREQMQKHFGSRGVLHAIQNKTIHLLSPATTYPNAITIAKALESFGFSTQIESEFDLMEHLNDQSLYIVLTPSYFQKGLPLNYVAFNFEQSTYTWWFTEDYIGKLYNALAVLDYTKSNITYLEKRGIPKGRLHYIPLTPNACDDHIIENKTSDCIFYGNSKDPRRAHMLTQLTQSVDIKIIENIFGEAMQQILRKVSIVVNIHSQENALLETTRICEAISHGCLVISETCSNYDEFPELTKLVEFVPLGDTKAIAERVSYWQCNPEKLKRKLEENRQIASECSTAFKEQLKHFLIKYHILKEAS